jgi:transcriptional regulator with XRE-family HTH domain
MGKQLPNIGRFRERITRERERRRWSQAEVARMLTAMGIDSIYNTTVAKIEAGDREIKLDEAVALAQLYEAPLDALVGLHPKTGRDLDYLMDALSDAAFLSRTDLRRHAKALGDRMADIPSDYQHRDTLDGLVRDVLGHLASAGTSLEELVEHFLEYVEQTWSSSDVKPKGTNTKQ